VFIFHPHVRDEILDGVTENIKWLYPLGRMDLTSAACLSFAVLARFLSIASCPSTGFEVLICAASLEQTMFTAHMVKEREKGPWPAHSLVFITVVVG